MKKRVQLHDNWATPSSVYQVLDDEFHFDFDPCPLNYKVNALTLAAWGKSNFINPPYSRALKEAFVCRALEESLKGSLCVLLLPVSTSTKLFHDVILPNAEIRFWRGRIKFLADGIENPAAKCGQMDNMVVIFRPVVE